MEHLLFFPQASVVKRLFIVSLILLLYGLGLFLVFNTTSAESLDYYDGAVNYRALYKQLWFGVLGVCLGALVWKMGYQRILSLTPFLYGITIVLLLSVFIPGLGVSVGGAKRWVNLLGYTLQPSEFVKFVLPLYCIFQCQALPFEQRSLKSICHLAALMALPIVLILFQPNNGTCAVLLTVLVTLCFILKIPLKYWALPICILFSFGSLFAYHLPYVHDRIHIYLHPESDLRGKGHQPYQAKIATGSGQLFGKGPGKSMQKFSYLPEAQNDYVAAIFAEEFGFFGALILILSYCLFAYGGYSIAATAKDDLGMYVAVIFTFLITMQAFLNLGVVTGLLPTTGLNLPFISQGGSSLVSHSCMLGLILSV